MWPVSLEKSLRNRFVKESPEAQKAAIVTDSPDNEPDFLAEAVNRPAKTPASSRDLIRLRGQLAIDDPSFNQPTHRLLFQKLGKALDSQSFTITAKDQELDRAYKAFVKAKPQKRRRVILAPNEDFVRMMDMLSVKETLDQPPKPTPRVTRSRAKEIELEEESEVESVVEDCIEAYMPKE